MAQEIQFCKGGGCTAKLGPGVLSRVLSLLPRGPEDKNLLIGYDSKDDAAVYKVSDDVAIVQTLDFFPPMVEDPYTFGQIAATNALSDIYAMGGQVKTALNIVCFPEAMDLVRRALRSGGAFFLSFKEGDFRGYRDGRWYTDMTPEGLRELAEGTGFEVLDMWESVDRRRVRWVSGILGL